jgi:hypothetical protein
MSCSDQKEWGQLDPQHCWMFTPACTKSWLCSAIPLLLDTQGRSYTIGVWSYETFIVIEIVIDRYLAVET